ncbi:MAG TPA: aldose 1-epimerase, partial [Myxococcota bacterium]|nr:aldose 1-epimerase [Myxococcota bacterium]
AIDRSGTELAIPARRRLVLDARGIPTGEVEDVAPFTGPLGERTFDDLFEAPADGEPFRAGGVAIAFETGAPYAQVYAPADEQLVAFEPMAAPTDALVTGRGIRHAPFEQRFRIELVR